jgi:hypothetical protein
MKLMRALMSASALLVGGIFAHHLAGSSIPSYTGVLGFLLLAFALTLMLLDEKLSEEKLFITVFIAQNGSHFLLGGESRNSILMLLSHLIAGIATYFVVVRGRSLLDSIENVLGRIASLLFPNTYPALSFRTGNSSQVTGLHVISFRQRLRYSALSLRAPPAPQ